MSNPPAGQDQIIARDEDIVRIEKERIIRKSDAMVIIKRDRARIKTLRDDFVVLRLAIRIIVFRRLIDPLAGAPAVIMIPGRVPFQSGARIPTAVMVRVIRNVNIDHMFSVTDFYTLSSRRSALRHSTHPYRFV